MTSQTTTKPAVRRFALRGYLLTVAVAAALNVAIYFIGSAAGGAMSVTMSGGQDIEWFIVIIATVVPLALAGIVVWLIAGRWEVVLRWLRWTGLVIAVASAFMPLSMSEDPQTAVSLAAMHVVAGLAWFLGTRARA